MWKNLYDTIRIMHVTGNFFLIFQSSFILEYKKEEQREDMKLKKEMNKRMVAGIACLAAFAVWTILIKTVDVQPLGQKGTDIGFAALNVWFHQLTGVHMTLYVITDWLGLAPVIICLMFGLLGLIQLFKRRNILKVDRDLLILGIYYVIVILGYLVFEMIPINYRPILIEGRLEASYPSSTTLLVMSVLPTLTEQINRRVKKSGVKRWIDMAAGCFTAFMVAARTISGVHWFTDIAGSVMLSAGLFCVYKAFVLKCIEK